MFMAKSGGDYVKQVGGKPCFRSTQNRSEAARFETAEAALSFAANVFSGSALAAAKAVPDAAPRPARWTRNEQFNDEPNHPGDGYMGR